jgi:hypothetical protein
MLFFVQLTTNTIRFADPIMYVSLLPPVTSLCKADITFFAVPFCGADFKVREFFYTGGCIEFQAVSRQFSL